MIDHLFVEVNGTKLHVAKTADGPAMILLHGWPEFWLTCKPVMRHLACDFTLFAPHLRGFGASEKPTGAFGPEDHAWDIIALMDALGLSRAGVVGHDVGGAVMQPLARLIPIQIYGLFFFDFVYPGIGTRMGEPDRLAEIWYQSFNQELLAPVLVGASRETCRAYIGHFLRHCSHRKDTFDDVLDTFVDNFLKPGNLAGGFAH